MDEPAYTAAAAGDKENSAEPASEDFGVTFAEQQPPPTEEQKAEREAKRAAAAASGSSSRERTLEDVIKNGCRSSFGGDRSRAVEFVINAMLERGRSVDDIIAVLIDPNNGIAAHVPANPEDPKQNARRQVLKAQQELATKSSAASGAAPGEGPDPDGVEIIRLAKLPPLQYEKERKAAAELLECRASILDRLVQAERERQGIGSGKDDDKQGHAICFPDLEPWPEPVDGAALLDEIAKAIRKHVIMSEIEGHTCALWSQHTYLIDCFQVSPRLGIKSVTHRCGKTTLLDVLFCLVLRPLEAANVTPAVIFRVVESNRPTLLIDEADTFLRNNPELRGILNSGHRKGGCVLRVEGDDHEPRAFATYGACVIATIGALPATLADRSITIALKRRLSNEAIAPFRIDRTDALNLLARKAVRWAQDNAAAVAAADPVMPKGVTNRLADNWRPLLAIASVAGGEWLKRCEAAALAAAKIAEEEGLLEMLLQDIKGVFPESEMSSARLVDRLVALQGRPWAEMGKSAKPLTQNRLARLLKPLGIGPDLIGTDRISGYQRPQFDEAFERYIPPDLAEGVSQPLNLSKCDEIRTSSISQPLSPEDDREVEKCEKSNNGGLLRGREVAKGDTGEDGGLGPDAIDRLAREVSKLKVGGATQLEAAIRAQLARCGVPPEAHDIEVEKVTRRIDEGADVDEMADVGHGPVGESPGWADHRPTTRDGYTLVGGTIPGDVCAKCGKTDEPVLWLKDPRNVKVSEHLHEDCAKAFFFGETGVTTVAAKKRRGGTRIARRAKRTRRSNARKDA